MKKSVPAATLLLSCLTFATSMSIATCLHGSPWSTVTIAELRQYGGLDPSAFSIDEAWRLVTAQLVHVKQAHMVFNVMSLFVLGSAIEKIAGRAGLLLLWLIGGMAGVVVSSFFAAYPYNVGTGASQAVLSIAAANLIAISRHHAYERWQKYSLAAILGLSLLLDIAAVHYPKPGHVTSFIVGLCLGYYLVPGQGSQKRETN